MKLRIQMIMLLMVHAAIGSGQVRIARIDSIVTAQCTLNAFEGNIMVAEWGKVLYQHAAGYLDESEQIAVNYETRFSIASITKMFTSIVVLQLVDEGKLRLEDNLEKHLPELAIPDAYQITMHDLLLHISGLPNENDDCYAAACSAEEFVQQALVNGKAPGKRGSFNYANLDYMLLGLVIESIDGMSWREAIQTRLLNPLNMRDSGFLSKDEKPKNCSASFSITSNGDRIKDPEIHIENFHAAGCMYSTTSDLLKLDQALYSDGLLSEKSLSRMYTSYPEYNYSGYSVWTYRYPFLNPAPLVMERRGGILGANSVLIRFLELNRTIIILSNNDQFNPDSFGDLTGLKEALMLEVGRSDGELRR